jgi:hypothetical protein
MSWIVFTVKIPEKKGAAVKQQTCWVDTRSYYIGEAEMPWAPECSSERFQGAMVCHLATGYCRQIMWRFPFQKTRTAKPDDPIRCVPHLFMKLNKLNKERCPISKDSPDYQGWSLRKPSGKPCQNTTADWIDVSNELEWKVCHWMRQS